MLAIFNKPAGVCRSCATRLVDELAKAVAR